MEKREFTFKVLIGGSMPHRTVDAPTDEEGYENIRQHILNKEPSGAALVPESIVLRAEETRRMPDPAWAAAEAFAVYKNEHPLPVPADAMTPLQSRMQSGGALTILDTAVGAGRRPPRPK